MTYRREFSWTKRKNFLLCAGLIWGGSICFGWSQTEAIAVEDLSAFRDPAESWRMAGEVTAPLDGRKMFEIEAGAEAIVNLPSDSNPGRDLVTKVEYGDMDLELEYMMPEGSNSGIYLQGRYELQLLDSWGKREVRFVDNGGIYEQWDDSQPEGEEGFGGIAPIQNASRAPGVWQKLKIAFRAPRFDESGKKIENARIVRAELNGALIHENVELEGPTRGSISEEESVRGPLRIQGDHGPVALRNIRIVSYGDSGRPASKGTGNRILVDPKRTPLLRSFMDVPNGVRFTHVLSVYSPSKVHYTYDLEHGSLVQAWRGDFLDATSMWHYRGDGSARPLGAVQHFVRERVLTVARLASPEAEWRGDSDEAGYRSLGYRIDSKERPTFRFEAHGAQFEDTVRVLEEGRGLQRRLRVEDAPGDLFVRLAKGHSIEELRDGFYLVDDHAYYLRLDENGEGKARVRKSGDQQELIVPLRKAVTYSILF